MKIKSAYSKSVVLLLFLTLAFSEVILNTWIWEVQKTPRIKIHQPSFTELTFGQEYIERSTIFSEETEDFYYFINVPEGNLKIEMTWIGVYTGLNVDLVIANDSSFTQIIISSLDNQGRFVIKFNIVQARTIFIHLGITNDIFLTLDFKLLVSRNTPPLNLSLIIFLIVIGGVFGTSLIIFYRRRKLA